MATIYHLAPAERWRTWPSNEPYLPAEFPNDGFVHCTAGDELMLRVANTFYRTTPGDYVLLVIDTERLTSPLKWEQSEDALASQFPHIYGPIDLAAVTEVRPAQRDSDGTFLGW
jgi:uncharacterized protein (DUF952 family)